MVSERKTARRRYEQLQDYRQPYLRRGRDAAALTIPSLLPKAGHTGASELPTPFQGMGARGVNNLASKLLLALLPPNSPFFRLMMDDFTLAELTGREEMRAEVEKALGSIERAVMSEVEGTAIRVSAFEALKHLLVAGNVLLFLPPEGGMKVYRLDRYVVKRDYMGNVLEIIVHEKIAKDALPPEVAKVAAEQLRDRKDQDEVDLYTWVRRQGDKVLVHQEAGDVIIPDSQGHYPLDRSPWLPLRFTRIDGEDYGRGHVEEYYGDIRSLEALTQAIVEGSAASAKVLFLVNPNGTTDERTISEAPNCGVRTGSREDVTVLQVDKYADFRVALEAVQMINQRLAQAFLLNTSIQRQAERVTAEEIRLMAGELEDALGGVYSILSQEFQLPLVRRLMHRMEMTGRLPSLPKNAVKPVIVAGMEALGRGHDLNRLMTFGDIIRNTLGPEVFMTIIHPTDFTTRIGTSLGIDMAGLVKTKEELERERQEAMQREEMANLGPAAIQAQAKVAQQAMKE
ncbi:portal protein [Telmatospirillum sp. J64-1]|uniref:portal protein n=1 Tax=Telmatospirillum sp. J64-1 TaxID=2502183 RepID=UPI00115C511F|nr:portal protein [Telmatospirillum sp. J64-1]